MDKVYFGLTKTETDLLLDILQQNLEHLSSLEAIDDVSKFGLAHCIRSNKDLTNKIKKAKEESIYKGKNTFNEQFTTLLKKSKGEK